MKKYELLPSL